MLQFHVKAMSCCAHRSSDCILWSSRALPKARISFEESQSLRCPGMRARIIQRPVHTLSYRQLGLFLFLLWYIKYPGESLSWIIYWCESIILMNLLVGFFFFVMTYSLLFSKTCPRFPVLVWYKTQFVQYCPTQFWGPTRRQRQLHSPICSCGMPEHDKDVPMGVWKYINLDQLNCGRFSLETMLAGKIPSFNLLKYFFAVGRRAHTVKELGSTYRCALTSVFPLMGPHIVEKQMSLGN